MNSFYLTRRAFLDIQKIYNYSQENWGINKTDEYLSDLYKVFNKISSNTGLGELRKNRSTPFLMYPCRSHYIIYEPFSKGIIILTVINQVRNIENIVQEFGSTFYNEIEALKSEPENKIIDRKD